jgi:tRNA C32,U32 (ribose-2'-O)-methylase TrmJ
MADLHLLVAVTGKSRGERNRRSEWPQVLDDVFGFADARVGFVFGREDHGLPNHMADRCDRLLTLPSDPDFSSFNLAQAVLLVAHAVYLREAPASSEAPQPYPPAPHDQMDRFMESVDQALVAMDFFKGNQRENILRTVRRVVRNASVDTQELATLWGMAAAVIRLAEQGTQRPPTPHQQRQQRAALPRTPPTSD